MLEITGMFKPKRVQLVSLGCSKNRVDSEKLLGMLSRGGIEVVSSDPPYSESHPDAIVINTCGFIQSAKEESINEILLALEAKKAGDAGMVIVCGCLSERYRAELIEQLPQVDAFFGTYEWKKVADFVLKGKSGVSDSTPENLIKNYCTRRLQTTPRHYAYLKISEGCNRRCSYCAIPLIKSGHVSVPVELLVKEAKILARQGVKELILIAQDTTFYGMDLYKKRMLAPLIRQLSQIKGIEWIRIHYSYPLAFPKDVISEMNSNPKVCKYLDIPLQHCSTKVLKAMRRGIDYPGTQKIINSIRKEVKGVALRTTLMVGHPGEGQREFAQLLKFVERNRFEMMGAFTYCEEEGTFDALNYKDSVPEKVKNERYRKLMTLQAKIAKENNSKRIGRIERVIVDNIDRNFIYTRSQWESPDVDGVILIPIKLPKAQKQVPLALRNLIGKFAAVRIIGVEDYDLIAELI